MVLVSFCSKEFSSINPLSAHGNSIMKVLLAHLTHGDTEGQSLEVTAKMTELVSCQTGLWLGQPAFQVHGLPDWGWLTKESLLAEVSDTSDEAQSVA